MNMNQFGKDLRIIRKQQGFGLNEFADKINVSRGYLSNLETGKTDTVTLHFLQQIQNELGLLPAFEEKIPLHGKAGWQISRIKNLLAEETDTKDYEYILEYAIGMILRLKNKNTYQKQA